LRNKLCAVRKTGQSKEIEIRFTNFHGKKTGVVDKFLNRLIHNTTGGFLLHPVSLGKTLFYALLLKYFPESFTIFVTDSDLWVSYD